MKRFLFDCGTRDPLASSGLLVLRVCTGLMMLVGHGWGKWQNFQQLKEKGEWHVPTLWPFSMMSPTLSLMATVFAEVGCAGLMVIGLATRPAAAIFGFAMLVAAFEMHAADPFFMAGGGAKEPAILYLIPCLVLVISGAGKWSADMLIYKEKKRKFF